MKDTNKPHLFLNNPRGEKNYFNISRKVESMSLPPKAPESYRFQKNKLKHSLENFIVDIEKRKAERAIEVTAHLEYIVVHFFVIFNNSKPFYTETKFKKWGMTPVLFTNFNQSVVFAINDTEKFKQFVLILEAFINSKDQIAPQGSPYSIVTIIYDFEFLSTQKIVGYLADDVLLSLVTTAQEIQMELEAIFTSLVDYLEVLKMNNTIQNYHSDGHSTLEILGISNDHIFTLVQNFDIIYKAQSFRIPTISENQFNQPELMWNLKITPPSNDVTIGILDNGVRRITPLENIVHPSNLDITDSSLPDATRAVYSHGTVVASLAALGTDFFDSTKLELKADAYILPIKILNFNEGCFNIYEIEQVIIKAIKRGVKIFNLSICGPTKLYNDSISEYAYLLDNLAYNYDILIFIATGNLDENDIQAMQHEPDTLHVYPNHFYNPNVISDYHSCEGTNICIPAESYNNITVGAIAENYRKDTNTDLTPFKQLPAYYTRKHYINLFKKINSTSFKNNQSNRHINKPDIVMAGGDRLNAESAMQVLGFGEDGDFYNLEAGTSLAAPLAANLAAKILGQYPDLNMQSVKALILNSARPLLNADFLDELVDKVKEEESQKQFGKSFLQLEQKQKMVLNSKISSDSLYRNLVGFGKPNIEKALFSENKSVTIIVQDHIAVQTHKVINVNIPKYLLKYSRSEILKIEATLCYKIPPVWGNQLSYNPLHISFNFLNTTVEHNPSMTAAIISDNKHEYFEQFFTSEMDNETKNKKRKEALGIKKNLQTWSEDFFPVASKLFSNVQHLTLNITKEEIAKVNNQISLAIRCVHKSGLEKSFQEFLVNNAHQFLLFSQLQKKPIRNLRIIICMRNCVRVMICSQ